MQEVTITIDKAKVMHEVAKASAYTGVKMMGDDPTAYDRISTTDEDREILERYWVEACTLLTNTLKPWLSAVGDQPIHHCVDIENDYEATLSLSGRYNTALTNSIILALTSYFIAVILSKWYRLTNKGESEAYGNEAAALLQSVEERLYYKKAPTYNA